ncbi:T9SS type A sorting domain-containing protein, partial [candidate division WOR-3 bacterium]|nr:T9SS type A sorting domain-containing protein [candidate division WOR-3 bacterium]
TLHDDSDDHYEIITSGLPSTEVRSVAADRNGRVWVATPQGAAAWSEDGVRVYSVQNSGLLSNNVYRVRVDASSRVWFLCDIGLSVFDQISGRWSNHTAQNSGMIANDQSLTNFYSALEIDDEHGVAAIGTQRGLSLFEFGVAPDTSGRPGVKVFPNPCVLGANEWVVVSELPEQASVEIRSLAGRTVAQLEVDQGMRRAVWRPGSVAGGIYLVKVDCPKGTRIERVAVVSR